LGSLPSSDTIDIVSLSSWMMDVEDKMAPILKWKQVLQSDFHNKQLLFVSNLHYDALYDEEMIKGYHTRLMFNIHNVIKEILKSQAASQITYLPNKFSSNRKFSHSYQTREFQLLFVIGAALHVTQDFYTHSNFLSTLSRENAEQLHYDYDDNKQCRFLMNVYNPFGDNINLRTYYRKGDD